MLKKSPLGMDEEYLLTVYVSRQGCSSVESGILMRCYDVKRVGMIYLSSSKTFSLPAFAG